MRKVDVTLLINSEGIVSRYWVIRPTERENTQEMFCVEIYLKPILSR